MVQKKYIEYDAILKFLEQMWNILIKDESFNLAKNYGTNT